MKKLKWISSVVLCSLFILSLAGCQSAGEKFDSFIQEEFVSAMEGDYTTAHVYLQNPEPFGVDESKIEVSLGSRADMDSQRQQAAALKERYREFQRFDREKLSDEQKDTYDIYEFQNSLNLELCDEKFDYYQQLFGSMTGLHYQLPTLFSDWELRSEQDVIDLIVLLQDVKPYMDSALEYTKTQVEKGLLMIDAQSVSDYCGNVIEGGESSAVLQSIYQNMEAVSLGEGKAADYQRQIKEAFTGSLIPAYEAIKEMMDSIQPSQNNANGLASFPNGKEYYELLLQSNIGSKKTVEEVRTMMQEALEAHVMNLGSILMSHTEVIDVFMSGVLPETGYASYTEILDDIRQRMMDDYPAVSELDYVIRDIHEEIASDSGVAAYFNIPPLDGTLAKQLRVNPKTGDISSIDTYKTVAHEGFPGHMYQYAYAYENLSSPFRKALASSSAYTEGYAVYSSYEAFRYLEGVDENVLAAYKENELASYCAIILADIGIHYDGWTMEDFSSFMNEQGFNLQGEAAQRQYQQLQANPCAFEPYYVGYQELAALKEKAQQELGGQFQEKAFNDAILKSGNAPFEVVGRHVEQYIQSVK